MVIILQTIQTHFFILLQRKIIMVRIVILSIHINSSMKLDFFIFFDLNMEYQLGIRNVPIHQFFKGPHNEPTNELLFTLLRKFCLKITYRLIFRYMLFGAPISYIN